MPVYEDYFVPTIKVFRSCLFNNGELIRDFALRHKFQPATFSAAINRHANLSDEMRQAILNYIKATKKKEMASRSSKRI